MSVAFVAVDVESRQVVVSVVLQGVGAARRAFASIGGRHVASVSAPLGGAAKSSVRRVQVDTVKRPV